MLKLGIVTPVLTLLPRAHATWEETGSFSDVVGIVREAERLGYHHCTCSEHVAIPAPVAATRGARYWDPLATFGALGAHTSTIRFAAHVLVLAASGQSQGGTVRPEDATVRVDPMQADRRVVEEEAEVLVALGRARLLLGCQALPLASVLFRGAGPPGWRRR